ncbi:MAG: metallophosphoesterase [Nitrosopumilus sp.]
MDLIFSDIHADISALDTIVNLATSAHFTKKYGEFSRVINLGDLLERGTNPKQVLEKMKKLSENYPMLSVMGNHDESFIYGRNLEGSSFESIAMHRALEEKELEFFTKNREGTFGIQEKIDKKNGLVCVHGGPLDPKKIMPESPENEWLYQKTWQRLSDDKEFFSHYGYHYSATSAFSETKTKTKNPIILCGHQHMEAALAHNKDGVRDILSEIKIQTEKIGDHVIEKREISIESDTSYLVRLGLGGPEGHYGTGEAIPHFGIIQDDQKKITLFGICK